MENFNVLKSVNKKRAASEEAARLLYAIRNMLSCAAGSHCRRQSAYITQVHHR